MGKFFKSKPYNGLLQINAMKSKYPYFKYKQNGDNDIAFIGDLFIKPELPIYTVSVHYRGSLSPIVKILNPPLVQNPPHYYYKTNTICLYHPDNYKWRKGNLIAANIMSWTIAWIYFYEYWLQTGNWVGPEVLHNLDKKENEQESSI
jgi:hypothetical protein